MDAIENCIEVEEYSDLNEVLMRMSSSGYFTKFQELSVDLYKFEYHFNTGHPLKSRDHIKTIICKIIDQVWKDYLNKFGPKREAVQVQSRELNHIPETTTPISEENSVSSNNHPLRKSCKPTPGSRRNSKSRKSLQKSNSSRITLDTPSSCYNTPGHTSQVSRNTILKSNSTTFRPFIDLSRISEFAHISSPGSFSKSPRNIGSPLNLSPGPAAYTVKQDKSRQNSPRPVISSSGTRHGYIRKAQSPGPNKYYPMKYCISKY
jgi:hypothetical protein